MPTDENLYQPTETADRELQIKHKTSIAGLALAGLMIAGADDMILEDPESPQELS